MISKILEKRIKSLRTKKGRLKNNNFIIEGKRSLLTAIHNSVNIKNIVLSKDFIKKITENALRNGIPNGVVLNVNIPSVKKSEIKGIKVCRQAKASWVEEFDKRKNPFGQDYYWLTGKFVNNDRGQDTDEWALNQNYISIVPVEFDLTAHHAIQELNEWNFK